MPPTSTPEPISTATLLPPTISPQIKAIEAIRTGLELPVLPIDFIENTGMINSPSGGLKVANYQDSAGRIYSVDAQTNLVVEIDARTLLPAHGANSSASQTLTPEVLKARAMKYVKAAIPGFEQLQSSWKYEEGGKGDLYFFSWYGVMTPGSMNRPFAQIGMDKSGLLFAFYNTLLLNQ